MSAARVLLFVAAFLFCAMQQSRARGHDRAAIAVETRFCQICDSSFARWDRNGDGFLNMAEVNALVEDQQVRGAEAAALVTLRWRLNQGDEQNQRLGMSREQVLAFARERRAQRGFADTLGHIESVNRTLFLPGEPSLLAIHQGALGDCYLLAVIGAVVNRNPQTVRDMIRAQPGGYEVHFPTGKTVSVRPLTDSDLVLLPGMDGDHGIWVAVLEEAYAEVRQDNQSERTGEAATLTDPVARDWLRGGRAPPTIEQWTGHKAQRMVLEREFQGDARKALKPLDPLLTKLISERRLVTAGKGDHLFAVLGYDPKHQIVRLFNPHGESSTPTGPPGPVNGYVTHHGVFEIPLVDFIQMFHTLSWETDEPLEPQRGDP